MIGFVKTDGGRALAGEDFPKDGPVGDCAVRALAIAAELDYEKAYDLIREENGVCPYNGTSREAMKAVLAELGWEWVPTMGIGTGCKVHVRDDELPEGRLILNLSQHYCAVIDGVVHDTYDPSRGGARCVYGYWRKP